MPSKFVLVFKATERSLWELVSDTVYASQQVAIDVANHRFGYPDCRNSTFETIRNSHEWCAIPATIWYASQETLEMVESSSG